MTVIPSLSTYLGDRHIIAAQEVSHDIQAKHIGAGRDSAGLGDTLHVLVVKVNSSCLPFLVTTCAFVVKINKGLESKVMTILDEFQRK